MFKVRAKQTIWLVRLHRLIKTSNLIGPISLFLERFLRNSSIWGWQKFHSWNPVSDWYLLHLIEPAVSKFTIIQSSAIWGFLRKHILWNRPLAFSDAAVRELFFGGAHRPTFFTAVVRWRSRKGEWTRRRIAPRHHWKVDCGPADLGLTCLVERGWHAGVDWG